MTYTRIAAAIRAKTLIVERLQRLGTLLVANDAGGEKKTAILKMLNIFVMMLTMSRRGTIALQVSLGGDDDDDDGDDDDDYYDDDDVLEGNDSVTS